MLWCMVDWLVTVCSVSVIKKQTFGSGSSSMRVGSIVGKASH